MRGAQIVSANMKEHPVIFSAPMIRALLAGTKVQTRRIIEPGHVPIAVMPWDTPGVTLIRPNGEPLREWYSMPIEAAARIRCLYQGWTPTKARLRDTRERILREGRRSSIDEVVLLCPYGGPGDRLWCRETWAVRVVGPPSVWLDGAELREVRRYGGGEPTPGCHLRARTTDAMVDYRAYPTSIEELRRSPGFTTYRTEEPPKWRPSIFMPRWASRITLEITDVRVQRVQDISEADAWAEGVDELDGMLDDAAIRRAAKVAGCSHEDARATYGAAWDEINGKRASWESNPYVWVLTFKRVEAR
jgi:hypothetical protein